MNQPPLVPDVASTTSQPRVVTLQTNPTPTNQTPIDSNPSRPREPAQAMTCANGHPVAEQNAKFCTTCGVALNVVVTATEVAGLDRDSQSLVKDRVATGVSSVSQHPTPQGTMFRSQTVVTASSTEGHSCQTCRGGRTLPPGLDVCADCRQLSPIAPGYSIDLDSFQWAFDGQAMAKLRTIGPLNSMARKVSDQIGRRWIETTFNGVRTSARQMPNVYKPAVHAARLLGVNKMPDVYVSGERPWDALTFGSDESAFIVIGSALVGSFRGPELGFLFAREMGHIRAGHALWKTVIRFLVGEHNPRSGLMKNGIVGLLDPGKWIEGAIEVPLLNWARQAEITADRAGLLALGHPGIVRRVLLSWSLKSPMLYRFVNQQAWLEQQDEDGADESLRLTEMVTSSTPYISRRLKLLAEYEQSDTYKSARGRIKTATGKASARITPNVAGDSAEGEAEHSTPSKSFVSCPACQQKIRIPVYKGGEKMGIRCPNQDCRKVIPLELKRSPNPKQMEKAIRNLQSFDD